VGTDITYEHDTVNASMHGIRNLEGTVFANSVAQTNVGQPLSHKQISHHMCKCDVFPIKR
jgi:hypothetical protein